MELSRPIFSFRKWISLENSCNTLCHYQCGFVSFQYVHLLFAKLFAVVHERVVPSSLLNNLFWSTVQINDNLWISCICIICRDIHWKFVIALLWSILTAIMRLLLYIHRTLLLFSLFLSKVTVYSFSVHSYSLFPSQTIFSTKLDCVLPSAVTTLEMDCVFTDELLFNNFLSLFEGTSGTGAEECGKVQKILESYQKKRGKGRGTSQGNVSLK